MIPTQPGVKYPFDPDNTWRPDNPFNQRGWQCPYCGQWIGDMQYHNCSGINPRPMETGPIVDMGTGGMMSEMLMYADFKKLVKRDTLAKFRDRFIGALQELENSAPEDEHPMTFGLDAIEDLFDNVAKGFYNDQTL